MPVSNLQALRQAVSDDLDSDEPRLVLADALQHVGDPRGELIAIQCELSRLGAETLRVANGNQWDEARDPAWISDALARDPDRVAALRAIEKRLMDDHGQAWRGDLVRSIPLFTRGFITHLDALRATDASSLFDQVPTLQSLAVFIEEAADILAEPRMQRLRQLRIMVTPTTDYDALFLHLATFDQLRELAFVDLDTSEHRFDDVFPTAFRAQLEALEITQPRHDALYRLANEAPHLRHLALAGRGDLVGDALARFSDRLDILELERAPQDFAAVAKLRVLRALRITHVELEDGDSRLLGELPALRMLDLSGTPFRRSLQDLVGGSGLTALTHLRLHACNLDDNAFDYFLRSPLAGRVRYLDLRANNLTDASLDGLARLQHLRYLHVGTLVERFDWLRAQLPTTKVACSYFDD